MFIYRLDISVVELKPGEYAIRIRDGKNTQNEKALFDACFIPEEEREKVLDDTFIEELAKRSTANNVEIHDIQKKGGKIDVLPTNIAIRNKRNRRR